MTVTAPERTDRPAALGRTKTGTEATRPLVAPLQAGDHLSRAEFERRYAAMTHVKKAELVEGVVYMPSPVHYSQHGKPHGTVLAWLVNYALATPGLSWADNATLRLDYDNELQPDAMLFRDQTCGGKCHASSDDFLEGSPELVVEVAASSASYDMHTKLRVYRRNGVQEYLVLLADEERAVWHVLMEGEYQVMIPDEQGILRSQVFPGLWLHPEHFWSSDLARLMAALHLGLASQEHAQFVATLASSPRKQEILP
jgi:Uma2 family endonuclease